MRHITKRLLAGMLFLGPLGASADPVALNFHQGGFDEGAMVSGSFVGHDLDNNGQLSSFDGEILDFIMSFTGNSLVSAFSLGFSDLFGLVYDLDGGPLGDGLSLDIEGVGATDFQFAYFAGPGPVDVCGIGVPCAAVFDHKGSFSLSDELITVSVPEPGTLALLCIGLAGFGFSRNRKNA